MAGQVTGSKNSVMTKNMRKTILTLLGVLALAESFGQWTTNTLRRKDIPRTPVDTVATKRDDVKIVVYADNTFSYLYTAAEELQQSEIYREHWDTANVFSYKSISYQSLPETVDVRLIGSLDEFRAPLTGTIISRYGPRGRRNHNGVDVPLKTGAPIAAAFDGQVRYSRYNSGGFGNLVIVRHPNGLETYYGHLSRRNVKAGDWVVAGQIIGYGGSTGRSRGPHLHFEVRYCDQTFDPQRIIDFQNGSLRYQTFVLEKSFFNIRSRATEGLEDGDDFDVNAFIAQNGGKTDEEISAAIAQEEKKAAEPVMAYHTVRSGETLSSIARRNGTTVDNLCRLNGMTRNSVLRIGRKLRVK